jgi:hypothetical protein
VRASIGGLRSRGSVRTIIDTDPLRVSNHLASLPVHPTRLEPRSLHRPLVLSRTNGGREVRVRVLQDGRPSWRSMERHEEGAPCDCRLSLSRGCIWLLWIECNLWQVGCRNVRRKFQICRGLLMFLCTAECYLGRLA